MKTVRGFAGLIGLLIGLSAVLGMAQSASAALIRYEIIGTVVSRVDTQAVVPPTSAPFLSLIGAPFRLTAKADPDSGRFLITSQAFHGSYSFEVGGFSGMGSTAGLTEGFLQLQNDFSSLGGPASDSLRILANEGNITSFQGVNGFEFGALTFALEDLEGDAFSDLSLPLSLDLSMFEAVYMTLLVFQPPSGSFPVTNLGFISAEINSIEVQVPEPPALALFAIALGGLGFLAQRRVGQA